MVRACVEAQRTKSSLVSVRGCLTMASLPLDGNPRSRVASQVYPVNLLPRVSKGTVRWTVRHCAGVCSLLLQTQLLQVQDLTLTRPCRASEQHTLCETGAPTAPPSGVPWRGVKEGGAVSSSNSLVPGLNFIIFMLSILQGPEVPNFCLRKIFPSSHLLTHSVLSYP